jgi:hypothetical protein
VLDVAMALISTLESGGVRYLRADLVPRPACYSLPPDQSARAAEANVISLGIYVRPSPVQSQRHLTAKEQALLHKALRRSVKVLSVGRRAAT